MTQKRVEGKTGRRVSVALGHLDDLKLLNNITLEHVSISQTTYRQYFYKGLLNSI